MPGWEDNFVDIEIECPYCNDKFITQMFILDGTVDMWCCGQDCYEEYHSKQNIRDRKIDNILGENDIL